MTMIFKHFPRFSRSFLAAIPTPKGYIPLLASVAISLTLTACGEEKQAEAPAEKDTANEYRELLDTINKNQAPTRKPAKITTATRDISFSQVVLGQEDFRTAVIINEGDEPLTIKEIRLGGETEIFSLSGSCSEGVVLQENRKNCRIDIGFRPGEPRQYQTSLTVVSDVNSPLFVTLTGSGVVPQQPVVTIAPPPAPIMPSAELLNAQRIQAQRAGAGLNVLQTGIGLGSTPWTLKSDSYGGIGFGQTESTLMVDRTRMITQDRYIPAVLETTINSQLDGGRAVAIVESHVYSGEDRNILIPAGSRMTGAYESLSQVGNTRLGLVWARVIRPDGVGINLNNSPSSDVMGRFGVIGHLDRRYFDRFALPLLISSIGIAANYAASDDNNVVQQVTGVGGGAGGLGNQNILSNVVTENISAEEFAARQFADQLIGIADRIIQENIDIRPVITVPAGTRFNIFPTQDIVLKKPQLMVGVNNERGLAQQAQELVNMLQRGEGSETALRLAEILGSSAQAGQINENRSPFSQPYNAPTFGTGQGNYGPPPR